MQKNRKFLSTLLIFCIVTSAFLIVYDLPFVHATGITVVGNYARFTANGAYSSFFGVMNVTPASGDVLVATYQCFWQGMIFSNLTQTGVTWSSALVTKIDTTSHIQVQIFLGVIGAGASTTVTAYTNGGSDGIVNIEEFSGVATSSYLDGTNSTTGSSTTPLSGQVTTTNANDLIVAVTGMDTSAQSSPSGGFIGVDGAVYRSDSSQEYLWHVVSSTGTFQAGTTGLSNNYCGAIVALKAAGASTVSVTFTSSVVSPASGWITVNGSAESVPYTIAAANVGDVYTIAANSPVKITWGNQYVFSSWSDLGAQSHTYTVSVAATVTATFTQQLYNIGSSQTPANQITSIGGVSINNIQSFGGTS